MTSRPSRQNERAYLSSRGLRLAFRAGAVISALTILVACAEQVVGWPVPDEIPPTVTSTTPDDEAVGVALNVAVTATFSETMNSATIHDDSFNVFLGENEVDGTVYYVGTTAVFTPDEVFEPGRNYTATIVQTVTDLAGNRMDFGHAWAFRTGP